MGGRPYAIPVVAVLAMAWLALFPITSIDAYYHLATGTRILEQGRIPVRGVGSATFGQAPWHDNEWGFQLLAAAVAPTTRDADGVLVLTDAGRAALILLRAACVAATLALMAATMARAGVRPLTRGIAVVLAGALTFGNLFWDVRPQILSYLALAGVGYLLERDRGGARWAAPGLLAIVAAWANVHGAFLVGIVVIGTEAVGELAEGARSRGIRLALVALAAPVAACLNPHGWEQVVHPFRYMLEPAIYAANAEWERPRLSRLPLWLASVALYVAGNLAGGRSRWGEIARVLALVLLFSTAIRHLPLAVIVLVPALAATLTRAAARGGWRSHLDPSSSAWGGPRHRVLLAGLLVAAIAASSGAKFVGLVPRFEERTVRPMPENAVRFLARERIAGNGFNAYRFGGFLMFRQYPQERVFMDGRNDLYGSFRTEVYIPLLEARPGWEAAWERETKRFDIGWVLIDESDGLARSLQGRTGWLAGPVTDGTPGRDGILMFLRDTEANRAALERWRRPAVPGARA